MRVSRHITNFILNEYLIKPIDAHLNRRNLRSRDSKTLNFYLSCVDKPIVDLSLGHPKLNCKVELLLFCWIGIFLMGLHPLMKTALFPVVELLNVFLRLGFYLM